MKWKSSLSLFSPFSSSIVVNNVGILKLIQLRNAFVGMQSAREMRGVGRKYFQERGDSMPDVPRACMLPGCSEARHEIDFPVEAWDCDASDSDGQITKARSRQDQR